MRLCPMDKTQSHPNMNNSSNTFIYQRVCANGFFLMLVSLRRISHCLLKIRTLAISFAFSLLFFYFLNFCRSCKVVRRNRTPNLWVTNNPRTFFLANCTTFPFVFSLLCRILLIFYENQIGFKFRWHVLNIFFINLVM